MSRLGGGGGTVLAELLLEAQHDTLIFPEDTNETMVFVAATAVDTFIAWTEITNNAGATFASFSTLLGDVHLSGVIIETAGVNNAHFLIELAYGTGATRVDITAVRIFTGGAPIEDMRQETKVRADIIPMGEQVWYRAKCDIGGSNTCNGHLRYHFH